MARTSWPGVPDLPEGEGVSFGAGAGERDLEGALGDGPVLPDELVQPLLVQVVLEAELGGVHPDHGQAVIGVLPGPGAEVGELAEPVDAGVSPEVDERDLSLQVGRCQRR